MPLWILLAVAGAGVVAYSIIDRSAGSGGDAPPVADSTGPAPPQAHQSAPPAAAQQAAAASPETLASMIAKLAADANGSNADTRSAAIVALAAVPKAQAVSILSNIMLSGERTVDRQLAVGSLRTLALDQGDEDGAIRAALRDAIYHGDDTDVALGAEAAVGDIENTAGQVVPH